MARCSNKSRYCCNLARCCGNQSINNSKKLIALIKTYFKQGGQEIQINATSRETLLDAMEHPEKYQNLVVRVSGFSAFYVTLDRAVQEDILRRTQQG